MGIIKAEIELVNPDDLVLVDQGKITMNEIRKMNVTTLVDTGAYMLCINQTFRAQLGFRSAGFQKAELADGSVAEIEVVGPVIVNFKNRNTMCRALVLPGNSQPLLGSIPMEDLDVIIVPLKQTIDINPEHPIMAQTLLK
jgi:clan AA aspartic protease